MSANEKLAREILDGLAWATVEAEEAGKDVDEVHRLRVRFVATAIEQAESASILRAADHLRGRFGRSGASDMLLGTLASEIEALAKPEAE